MFELKDFQQKSVDYIYSRLKEKDCQRFLCADEVGLGKTIIAKGVIDRFKEARGGNLKVFYICSSQYLARQNLEKLHPDSQKKSISRLTELILYPDLIEKSNGLSILPLSPQTSVDMNSRGGMLNERIIIYQLLRNSGLLPGKRETTYEQVLSLGINNWSERKDKPGYTFKEFDPNVRDRFYQLLKSKSEVLQLMYDCFDRISDDYRKLIGELRQILATAGLESLKPDLIILDEFQRFADILKSSEEDDATDLVQALFSNDHTEMLMLSATPYKMYTIREENLDGNSHYDEFQFLMKFLMRGDYQAFIQDWTKYTEAMLSLRYFTPDELGEITNRVERWLYKYICRTERNIAYEESPERSLLHSRTVVLDIDSRDLSNFMAADQIVQKIEANDQSIYSPLEYCKTAPYPLSFMEKYKLKNLFRELYDDKNPGLLEATKQSGTFLPFEILNSYSLQDFPNAKMNWLIKESVEPGSQLLWIPPSMPYYKLEGPFQGKEGFSKTMIFGKFAVEPRAISTIASYAAECFTTGNPEAIKIAPSSQVRQYFANDNSVEEGTDQSDAEEITKQTRLPRPRLVFKNDDSSYSLLSYCYPSWYLADLVNSNLKLDPEQSLESVRNNIGSLIKADLQGMESFIQRPAIATDARWYLFALLFLDYKNHPLKLKAICSDDSDYDIDSWEMNKNLNQLYKWMKVIDHSGPSGLAVELGLGSMPLNLESTLASIALGGSACVMLQTLLSNVTIGAELSDNFVFPLLFTSSVYFANASRSYFNSPEAISIIDLTNSISKSDYWLAVINYNMNGCLRAVLDEYFYMQTDGEVILKEEEEKDPVIIKIVETLASVLSIRTSTLDADLLNSRGLIQREALRIHYAIAFIDQQETEDTNKRKQSVQDAFNSPFRPFILATTSIGQEGLDFHKYCRELMHWSLPDNAIDLEQREGRINRYKHFALRLNLFARYKGQLKTGSIDKSPWTMLFAMAENDHMLRGDKCQLVPYWHVPLVKYPLERTVPLYPFSKDGFHLERLLKTLMVYRMSLGQPNQEDLVKYLLQNFSEQELETYKAKLMINLSPVAYAERAKEEKLDVV